MPVNESSGTYTTLNGDEAEVRYFMAPSVVKAKRLDPETWEVTGPWPNPFHVDEETFRQKFSEL